MEFGPTNPVCNTDERKGSRMLVLSRRQNEEILIGEGISISIISVRGGRVKLGIEAPKSVRVVRAEITSRDEGAVREFTDSGGVEGMSPVLCGQSV